MIARKHPDAVPGLRVIGEAGPVAQGCSLRNQMQSRLGVALVTLVAACLLPAGTDEARPDSALPFAFQSRSEVLHAPARETGIMCAGSSADLAPGPGAWDSDEPHAVLAHGFVRVDDEPRRCGREGDVILSPRS